MGQQRKPEDGDGTERYESGWRVASVGRVIGYSVWASSKARALCRPATAQQLETSAASWGRGAE